MTGALIYLALIAVALGGVLIGLALTFDAQRKLEQAQAHLEQTGRHLERAQQIQRETEQMIAEAGDKIAW